MSEQETPQLPPKKTEEVIVEPPKFKLSHARPETAPLVDNSLMHLKRKQRLLALKKAVDSAAGIGLIDMKNESEKKDLNSSIKVKRKKKGGKSTSPYMNESITRHKKPKLKYLDDDKHAMERMKAALACENPFQIDERSPSILESSNFAGVPAGEVDRQALLMRKYKSTSKFVRQIRDECHTTHPSNTRLEGARSMSQFTKLLHNPLNKPLSRLPSGSRINSRQNTLTNFSVPKFENAANMKAQHKLLDRLSVHNRTHKLLKTNSTMRGTKVMQPHQREKSPDLSVGGKPQFQSELPKTFDNDPRIMHQTKIKENSHSSSLDDLKEDLQEIDVQNLCTENGSTGSFVPYASIEDKGETKKATIPQKSPNKKISRPPSASPEKASQYKSKDYLYQSVLKDRPTSVTISHREKNAEKIMQLSKSSQSYQSKQPRRKKSETSHFNAMKHMQNDGGFDLHAIQGGRLSQIPQQSQRSKQAVKPIDNVKNSQADKSSIMCVGGDIHASFDNFSMPQEFSFLNRSKVTNQKMNQSFASKRSQLLLKQKVQADKQLNILPAKFALEKRVGNTNKQPVPLLKPKWAGKVEVKWLTDGSMEVRPPKICVGYADDYFYEQMPILISSYNFLKKKALRGPEHIIDFPMLNPVIIREQNDSEEVKLFTRKVERQHHILREEQNVEHALQSIKFFDNLGEFSQYWEMAALDRLNPKLFEVQFDSYQNNYKQIWETTGVLFSDVVDHEGNSAGYQCLYDYIEEDEEIASKSPPEDRPGEIDVLKASRNPATAFTMSQKELAETVEHAIAMATVREKARAALQLKFKKGKGYKGAPARYSASELLVKHYTHETQWWDRQNMLPASRISIEVDANNRDEVYAKAQSCLKRTHKILQEFDMVTEEFLITLHTDYAERKRLNNKLQEVFATDTPRIDMFEYIKNAWSDYLTQLDSLQQGIKNRITGELDAKLGEWKLTSCPSSLHDVVREDNFFEEERIAWAYDHYKQFVYADFPKPRLDQVIWGQKVVEDNKHITTDWKQSEYFKKSHTLENHLKGIFAADTDFVFQPEKGGTKYLTRKDYVFPGVYKIKHLVKMAKLRKVEMAKKRLEDKGEDEKKAEPQIEDVLKRPVEERIAGYINRNLWYPDSEQESDNHALGFYKCCYDDVGEDYDNTPRMEIIRVYHALYDYRANPWMQKPLYQHAMWNMYKSAYQKVQAKREAEKEKEEEKMKQKAERNQGRKENVEVRARNEYLNFWKLATQMQGNADPVAEAADEVKRKLTIKVKGSQDGKMRNQKTLSAESFDDYHVWSSDESGALVSIQDSHDNQYDQIMENTMKRAQAKLETGLDTIDKTTEEQKIFSKIGNQKKDKNVELTSEKAHSDKGVVDTFQPSKPQKQQNFMSMIRGKAKETEEEAKKKRVAELLKEIPALDLKLGGKDDPDEKRQVKCASERYLSSNVLKDKSGLPGYEDYLDLARRLDGEQTSQDDYNSNYSYARRHHAARDCSRAWSDSDKFSEGSIEDYMNESFSEDSQHERLHYRRGEEPTHLCFDEDKIQTMLRIPAHANKNEKPLTDCLNEMIDSGAVFDDGQNHIPTMTFTHFTDMNTTEISDTKGISRQTMISEIESSIVKVSEDGEHSFSKKELQFQKLYGMPSDFVPLESPLKERGDRQPITGSKDTLDDFFNQQLVKDFLSLVKKGERDKVLNYIKRFNINLETSRDHLGNTPLNLAAQAGDSSMCQLLLEKGSNQSATNNIGRSAEDYAYEFFNKDCIEIFKSIDYSQNKMPKVEFSTVEQEEKKEQLGKIRIEYFDKHGLAEPIRMMLAHAENTYESHVVTNEEWEKVREDEQMYEFGKLPVLVLDEKRMGQSTATMRSIAIRLGYYNVQSFEQAYNCDVVLEAFSMIYHDLKLAMVDTNIKGHALCNANQQKMKQYEEPTQLKRKPLDTMLAKLDTLLILCCKNMQDNSWAFIADDQITIADFCLAALYWSLAKNIANPFHNYIFTVFKKYPQISGYLLKLDQELKWHLQQRSVNLQV